MRGSREERRDQVTLSTRKTTIKHSLFFAMFNEFFLDTRNIYLKIEATLSYDFRSS